MLNIKWPTGIWHFCKLKVHSNLHSQQAADHKCHVFYPAAHLPTYPFRSHPVLRLSRCRWHPQLFVIVAGCFEAPFIQAGMDRMHCCAVRIPVPEPATITGSKSKYIPNLYCLQLIYTYAFFSNINSSCVHSWTAPSTCGSPYNNAHCILISHPSSVVSTLLWQQ